MAVQGSGPSAIVTLQGEESMSMDILPNHLIVVMPWRLSSHDAARTLNSQVCALKEMIYPKSPL